MNQQTRVTILFGIVLILAGCASPTLEKARLPGEMPGWKLGHKQRDRLTRSTILEYVPANEYMGNWTKMYTIQFYARQQDDPEIFMQRLKSKKARLCNTIQSTILAKQTDSILYEWKIKGCKRFKNQHELARIIRGKDGLHRLAYTEKTLPISPETYQKWKKKLQAAYLETGGQ